MPFWHPERKPDTPGHYELTARPGACVGPPEQQFFMGGVAMAAALDALEQETGKPLLWATIQFLNHAYLHDVITITTETVSGGRNIKQMAARLHTGDTLLHTLIAAFGARTHPVSDQVFIHPPKVPPPDACDKKQEDAFQQPGNLLEQFERRTALADDRRGVEALWIRPTFTTRISASFLALVSDFFLGAHPLTRRGTSLDNTFRLHAPVSSPLPAPAWLLTVTQLNGFVNGAVHGTQHIFSEDGHLLSSSSQTGLLPGKKQSTSL